MIMALLLLSGRWGWAAAPEYELKAAFVYNFAKFVEWPPRVLDSTSDTIILGLLEQDPERAAFEALQGKTVQGRTLIVKSCSINQLKGCHLVFISTGANRFLPSALEALQNLPVLTVTDEVEPAALQGIINLVTQGGKVRFQVNAAKARSLGIKISSHLLQLAVTVTE